MGSKYRVTLCTKPGCHHPGGQHIMAGQGWEPGCRLCECPGWDEDHTVPGWWSDEQQQQAEERAGRLDGEDGP